MRKYDILLVDDDAVILNTIGPALENKGYQVTTADSGEKTIEIMTQKGFDLVITDLVMGPTDGINVLKKSKEIHPETMVIILTGFGDMTSAIDALRLDADDYILKPCEPEEMYLRVSHCLEKLELKRKVKIYEDILPVCCVCNKIRDDSGREPGTGQWMSIYKYMRDKAKVDITSTYCPECVSYGMGNIGTDITEWKRTEEALRENEKKYRLLFETMNEGVCLHEIIYDETGEAIDYKIIDVNPSYEFITGLKKERAIGSNASELYGIGEPPFLDIYAKVADTGEPTTFVIFSPSMEKYFNISVISPDKGKFATVFTDLTERKLAEESLKQANEKLLRTHDQRKIISKRLIDLLEKDRHQIAVELHDHIGQILVSLKMDIEIIHGHLKPAGTELGPQIRAAEQKAIQAINDIDKISHGLSPTMLDTLGLVSSLRELFDEIRQQADMEIRFFSKGIPKRFEGGKGTRHLPHCTGKPNQYPQTRPG